MRKHICHLACPLSGSSSNIKDVLSFSSDWTAEERIFLVGLEESVDDVSSLVRFELWPFVRKQ